MSPAFELQVARGLLARVRGAGHVPTYMARHTKSQTLPSLPVNLNVLFAAAMGYGDHNADTDQNRNSD